MSIRDLVLAVEREARAEGIALPMSRLRDAIARAIFSRTYSQILAAEAAGSLGAAKLPPSNLPSVASFYGLDADAFARAFNAVENVIKATASPALQLETHVQVRALLKTYGLEDESGWVDDRCVAALARIARSIAVALPDVTQRESLNVVLTARKGVLETQVGAYLPLLKVMLGARGTMSLRVVIDWVGREIAPRRGEDTNGNVPVVSGFSSNVVVGEVVRLWPEIARKCDVADVHVIYSDDAGARGTDYLLVTGFSEKGTEGAPFSLTHLAAKTVYSTTGRLAFTAIQHVLSRYRIEHSVLEHPSEGVRPTDGTIELIDRRPDIIKGMARGLVDIELLECASKTIDMGVDVDTVLTRWKGSRGRYLLAELVAGESKLRIGMDEDGTLVVASGGRAKRTKDRLSDAAVEKFRRLKVSAYEKGPLTWEAFDWLTRELLAGMGPLDDESGSEADHGA